MVWASEFDQVSVGFGTEIGEGESRLRVATPPAAPPPPQPGDRSSRSACQPRAEPEWFNATRAFRKSFRVASFSVIESCRLAGQERTIIRPISRQLLPLRPLARRKRSDRRGETMMVGRKCVRTLRTEHTRNIRYFRRSSILGEAGWERRGFRCPHLRLAFHSIRAGLVFRPPTPRTASDNSVIGRTRAQAAYFAFCLIRSSSPLRLSRTSILRTDLRAAEGRREVDLA